MSKIRMLVTGGCGFIGSNFVNYMVKKHVLAGDDALVVNMDAMYYCALESNVDECVRKSDNYVFVKGKIQDKDLVAHVLKEYDINYVVHFAAQSHVDNSFTDSLAYTYDNVYGTHVLLECCREWGKISKFVHISTDEVYGESGLDDPDGTQKNETSLLCPTNPYAATKAASELISKSYYYSFGMPVVTTRCNNVYGPNQYIEKVIPRFIHQLVVERAPCTIQGDGNNMRAFIHVDDVVRAVDIICAEGKAGEVYNIGSPDEVSIKDLAEIIIRHIKGTGSGAMDTQWIKYVDDRQFNDKRYYISDAKVRMLGWAPEIEFREGLARTIDWYVARFKG